MAEVTLRGGGPGVVVIVRDPERDEVATSPGADGAHLFLPEGLFALEASYPDGRVHRVQLRVQGDDQTVVLPSSTGAERPARPYALASHVLGTWTPPDIKEPWTPSLKGLEPQRLVVGPGQPLVEADASVGHYLQRLGDARFTGDVEVSLGDVGGRFSLSEGEVKKVALGKIEPARRGEMLERLRSPSVSEASVSVRRKGWYVSCWHREGGEWAPRPLLPPDGDSLSTSLSGATTLLQVISPQRSEFVAFSRHLPEAKLVIDEEGRVRLDFQREAQALLEFVNVGNRRAAEVLARSLVQQKFDNAPLAAVGGYFLLDDTSDRRIPEQWWENLARLEVLPDGAILAGWRALRADAPEVALEWFLTAERRGLPLFTRGLNLLLEGLWAFGRDGRAKAAAERLKPYADSARRASVVTVFSGASPDNPTRLEAPVMPPQWAVSIPQYRLANGLNIRSV